MYGLFFFYDVFFIIYVFGGVCMINIFDVFFQQLIQEKNVQVIFISDVCWLGILVGSFYGGL